MPVLPPGLEVTGVEVWLRPLSGGFVAAILEIAEWVAGHVRVEMGGLGSLQVPTRDFALRHRLHLATTPRVSSSLGRGAVILKRRPDPNANKHAGTSRLGFWRQKCGTLGFGCEAGRFTEKTIHGALYHK